MKTVPRTRNNKKFGSRPIGLLAFLASILALFLIFGPKEATKRALNIKADGTLAAEHQGLIVSEIMSDNASALPDENGNFADWIEIYNSTDAPMNLTGISLSNRPDKAKFLFPAITLGAKERLIVFCDDTNQNTAGQPLHAKFKLSSIQASVYLFDTMGIVLSSVDVPTLNANETYYYNEETRQYQIGENFFSPGYENTAAGHGTYMDNYRVDNGELVINEFIAAPRSGLHDEDGDLSDWIEIKNNGTKTIELKHYALSDNEQRPIKWVFPDDAAIGPGGIYLVFASGKNRSNPGGYPHTNFSLSAEGETLTLSTRQGQLVDRIVYSNLPADQSYGRNPDTGAWQVFAIPTPGAENNANGIALADRYLKSLNKTGVFISEAMSSNATFKVGAAQELCDWVEIANKTDKTVDLSGFGLSDSITWPRKWQFPMGTSIFPGEHKIILLNKSKAAGTNAASLSASYALSRMGNETLTLSDPNGKVLDRMYLPQLPVDVSYGRSQDRDGFFYFDSPTPGEANAMGFPGFTQTPVLSRAGGLYKEDFALTLTVSDQSNIRYTTDGSIPTLDNSQPYQGPIPISNTTVIRARSFAPGLKPSEVVTATYVMKTYYSMPVVALTTDPDQLWNEETGMYATGKGIDLASYKNIPFRNPTPIYRTHGKIFRPGFAEMFDSTNDSVVLSQGVEFALIGQYSLDMPQKSFKVKAKASLGKRYFEAKLFEDRPFDSYKSFVLRVSGNDAVWTRIVDGVQSRLISQVPDTTVIHQAWRPVIVYLNGQYWGHYNMRERVSRYFVAQHEGIPMEKADDMTILEASNKSFYGANTEYKKMVETIKKSSPATNAEDLQYILDNVDVDNLFDFLFYQVFFANTDSGNIRFYRIPGGKWRWIIYDMDYGLFSSSNNGILNMMNPKGHGSNDDIDNTVWLKLLENDEMRARFFTRCGELFRFFTVDRMLTQVDECVNLIQPEMNMHYERWAAFNLKNISMEQPQTVDGAMRYWVSRIDRLRNVIRKRPRHFWVQMKEWYNLSDEEMIRYFGEKPEYPPEAILNKRDNI